MTNYKKAVFLIAAAAAIACAVIAFCFLTNPKAERRFPINGQNVSALDTAQIVDRIARAETLKDSSLLCVNTDNFTLEFTSDFDWANDGAIRFFYTEKSETYSSQLRMFHAKNQYYITDRTKWTRQNQIYKLSDYLNALKYMPQEEIRRLSQDADGYSVIQMESGVPGDHERTLTYSADGPGSIDGWYIHLTVQPLHEINGAYRGSGDEIIHLFYGAKAPSSDAAEKNFDFPNASIYDSMAFDIDGDGVTEYCTLGYGRTSGLFTFTISAAADDIAQPKYHDTFCTKWYDLSFLLCSDGIVRVQGIDQDNPPQTHLFDIAVVDGSIRLTEDGQNIALY